MVWLINGSSSIVTLLDAVVDVLHLWILILVLAVVQADKLQLPGDLLCAILHIGQAVARQVLPANSTHTRNTM